MRAAQDQVIMRALADTIEIGRQKHPDWGLTTGVAYRDAKGHEVEYGDSGIAFACAMGFAEAGGYYGPSVTPVTDRPCPAGCHAQPGVIHLNDEHGWTPEQIVVWLRSIAD